jgi:hypothetical protein
MLTGFGFKKNYQPYKCTDQYSAMTCDNSCKIESDMKYQIEVNENKNLVLRTVFYKGKQVDSNLLENCKVINEKNWLCDNSQDYQQLIVKIISKDQMVNAVYATWYFWENKDSGKIEKSPEPFFFCAK